MVVSFRPAPGEDRGPRTEVVAGHFLLRGSYPRFITGSRPGADMPRGFPRSVAPLACCAQTAAIVTAGWIVTLGLLRSVALLVWWSLSCGAAALSPWGFRFMRAVARARRAGVRASSARNACTRSGV